MDKHLLRDLAAEAANMLAGLAPAAIGAVVMLAFEQTLSWTERFLQLAVGVTVSYFVSPAIGVVWQLYWHSPIDPFLLQASRFVLGMIAYKATPRFVGNLVDVIAGAPVLARDWIKKRIGS